MSYKLFNTVKLSSLCLFILDNYVPHGVDRLTPAMLSLCALSLVYLAALRCDVAPNRSDDGATLPPGRLDLDYKTITRRRVTANTRTLKRGRDLSTHHHVPSAPLGGAPYLSPHDICLSDISCRPLSIAHTGRPTSARAAKAH